MPQEDEYTYEDKLQREILFFLYKEGCWGGYHYKIIALQHMIRVDSISPAKKDMKKELGNY